VEETRQLIQLSEERGYESLNRILVWDLGSRANQDVDFEPIDGLSEFYD